MLSCLRNFMKKIAPFSVIIIALSLFLLISSLITQKKSFSANENRYLSSFPKFSVSTFMDGSYMKKMDDYLNDHFFQRDFFLSLKTATDRILFQNYMVDGIYVCKNGYLMNRYTEEDINYPRLQQNITYINEFQNKYQADVALIPTASEVLHEYLPVGYDSFSFDTSLADVHTTIPAYNILDSHRNETIYYKTDHHWTLLGAYYVYQQYVDSPVPYAPITVTQNFRGTTAKKIGFHHSYDSMQMQKSSCDFTVTYDESSITCTDSLYSTSYLPGNDHLTDDPYSFYLDGNHAITQITNHSITPDKKQESILLIKDSFGNTFATLLAENYKNVYLIDLRYYNGSISDFIEKNQIQNILFLYNNYNFSQDKNLIKLLR